MRQCMNSDKLHLRINKMIGQLNAISKMIDEDVPCEEVLIQINAVRGALHRVGQIVLEGHLKHCVRDGIEHGDIRIAFNPDEEIGMGAHHFDVERFGCQWAYTMDGGDVGELEYENFNAASAKVNIRGVSVHPGYAKGKMVNANRLAVEFASMLPADETPETTEGYEGFYHLIGMHTNTESAQLSYIIRDHDRPRFEARKRRISQCVADMNAKYGEGTVEVELKDQYYNMREKIEPEMHVIDIVLKAMQECEVTPKVQPIRGGTDGAQLSFRGLPCPNIFAGGVNFHGPYEFVSIQSMEKAMNVIIKICQLAAHYNK